MTSSEKAQAIFHPNAPEIRGLVLVGDDAPEKVYELDRQNDVRPIGRARSDYEGTLTDGEYGEKPSSGWKVAREFMVGDNPAHHAELGKKYGRHENDGTFTFDLSREWNEKANALLPGMDYDEFLRTLMSRTVFKRGFNTFIGRLTKAKIPLEIVSSGFEQTIIHGLTARGIAMGGIAIYANRLHVEEVEEDELDERGTSQQEKIRHIVTGIDHDRVVHSLNKYLFTAALPSAAIEVESDISMDLVMGDKLHDAQMSIRAPEDSFIIRADGSLSQLHKAEGPAAVYKKLHESKEAGFDAVATERTLHGPNQILMRNLIRRGLEASRRAA